MCVKLMQPYSCAKRQQKAAKQVRVHGRFTKLPKQTDPVLLESQDSPRASSNFLYAEDAH